MNDADAYTMHMTIARDAIQEAEFCRDNHAPQDARRWALTARRNIGEAAKCVAAMAARAAARKGGAR